MSDESVGRVTGKERAVAGESKGIVGAVIKPASILTRDTNPGLFPFEAFEFSTEDVAAPVLTLKSPWTLTLGAGGSLLYSPVSGEPSLGTPHAHPHQFIVAGSQVVGFTDYDLAAQLPVGTKMVWVWGYWNMAGGVGYIYVENSASFPGGLGFNPSAAVQGVVSGLVIFNGDRKIRIIVGAFNATAMNFFISPYWI